MKLWILKARDEDLPCGDNPWEPWYDKNFGLVVRATSEERARQLAQSEAKDEARGTFLGDKIANTNSPWLDAKYSTCDELTPSGEEGVLLIDYRGA